MRSIIVYIFPGIEVVCHHSGSSLCKTVHQILEAFDFCCVAGFHRFFQAFVQILRQNNFPHTAQSAGHGRDLDQNLGAVFAVFHHFSDTAQMTGNPVESGLNLFCVLERYGCLRFGWYCVSHGSGTSLCIMKSPLRSHGCGPFIIEGINGIANTLA